MRARLVLVSFAAALTGCASASAAQSAAPDQQLHVQAMRGVRQDANPQHTWAYVASGTTNVIAIYDLEASAPLKIGQITQGLSEPAGLALDAQGALYAANYRQGQAGGSVAIYPAGAQSPSLTLKEGLSVPIDVAVDTNGDVYVANRGSAPSIVVYPAGQTTPSETITSPLIREPNQLTFDTSRNLYFSDAERGISVLPHGSQQPVSLNLQGLSSPSGLTLDPTDGNIFVSDLNQHQIFVYAAGTINAMRTLRPNLQACSLGNGKIKNAEYIFIPTCSGNNEVWLFKHRSKNADATLDLNTDNGGVTWLAIKPPGVP